MLDILNSDNHFDEKGQREGDIIESMFIVDRMWRLAIIEFEDENLFNTIGMHDRTYAYVDDEDNVLPQEIFDAIDTEDISNRHYYSSKMHVALRELNYYTVDPYKLKIMQVIRCGSKPDGKEYMKAKVLSRDVTTFHEIIRETKKHIDDLTVVVLSNKREFYNDINRLKSIDIFEESGIKVYAHIPLQTYEEGTLNSPAKLKPVVTFEKANTRESFILDRYLTHTGRFRYEALYYDIDIVKNFFTTIDDENHFKRKFVKNMPMIKTISDTMKTEFETLLSKYLKTWKQLNIIKYVERLIKPYV